MNAIINNHKVIYTLQSRKSLQSCEFIGRDLLVAGICPEKALRRNSLSYLGWQLKLNAIHISSIIYDRMYSGHIREAAALRNSL